MVAGIFPLHVDGDGQQFPRAACDLQDVGGLVSLQHIQQGVIEGLRAVVEIVVFAAESVPGLLDGLDCGDCWSRGR